MNDESALQAFEFVAVHSQTGQELQGKVSAKSEAEAIARLRAKSLMIVSIKQLRQSHSAPPVDSSQNIHAESGRAGVPVAKTSAADEISGNNRDQGRYKVLTQKDKWFSGKFDPQRLENALNQYATMGWRICGVCTAQFTGALGGSREEMVVFLERVDRNETDRS